MINNLKYFIKYDLEEEAFRIKDEAVEDCIYEFEESKIILPKLTIKNADETLDALMNKPKSFARFGDGEIHIMQGENSPFQDYHPELARKMLNILSHKRDDLYVGLNRSYFQSPFAFSERNHKFYRKYGTQFRRFFVSVCDYQNEYLDACCFGGYFRLPPDFDFESMYHRNKQLFAGKKIALLAGEGIF